MRERKAVCQIIEMKQMTTEELDRKLQSELRKESPDEKVVLSILKELRKRECDHRSEITEEVNLAWEDYQAKVAQSDRPTNSRKNRWTSKIAAVAAVMALLILVFPFAVDADGTMDVLYRITDSIIEFFSPGRKNVDTVGEYIFETENPGLQQVYEAVVKMGITDPVVPMWLPEGYVLEEMEVSQVSGKYKLYAKFISGDMVVVLQIIFADIMTTSQYEQYDVIQKFDVAGIKHIVANNGAVLSAVWVNGTVECLINTMENDRVLYEIIESIYWRK